MTMENAGIKSNAPRLSEKSSPKIRVLVADDERGARMALEAPLRLRGFEVVAVASGQVAVEIGQKDFFDVLLTDVYMPGMNGLEVVREFRRFSPETKIIVMTGQGSMETAMQAVEQGAFDFIAKPFDIEEVLSLVRRATEPQNAPIEAKENEPDFSASGIIGHSPQIVRVYKLIARAARTKSTVLIEGETGTGKELAARAIHQNSERAVKPFVAVNCSALTETLLESELFGYAKGSFTGAGSDRAGLFESANGGTIFLDEIGSASLSLQASLLRVLQEQEIRRVGANDARKIDARVIAASNQNLEGLVESGEFRADLFYRLSVLTIPIPPLRTRGCEDLELLVNHLLKKHAGAGNAPLKISEEAIEVLSRYEWTGNVRELENAVEYAMAVCSGDVITVSDLPERIAANAAPAAKQFSQKPISLADDRPTIEELTRRYVSIVLAENAGNKTKAAEILGVNRRTLYRYLDVADGEINQETPADSA
ncbi:MAG: sigma-54-dependent Fis family transcriptional regulator [Blastocatellia bacterium]|nr:sigma-54-dependent Fis family transcriptional regulator [Blastocatellia bacterium]